MEDVHDVAEIWAFHGPDLCGCRPCPVHAPSAHTMRAWPIALPLAPYDLVLQRVCPHGVLHPDPDGLGWAAVLDPSHACEHRVHACDGCCGCVQVNARAA